MCAHSSIANLSNLYKIYHAVLWYIMRQGNERTIVGYSDIRRKYAHTDESRRGGFVSFIRKIFGLRSAPAAEVTRARVNLYAANPYSVEYSEKASTFHVGEVYHHAGKNRVFACVSVKGKRSRRVLFGCIDRVASDIELAKSAPELVTFHKVRTVYGVETCEHGNLRADRCATPEEIEAERRFLKDLRGGRS